MFSKKIALAVLVAVSAYAQSTSSIPEGTLTNTPTATSSGSLPSQSVSPCILSCATGATQCSFTDASCVCTNTDYQTAVAQCLQANCTPADVAQAQEIQAALCGSSSSILSSVTSSLSSRLSSIQSSVSSRVSSASSRISSVVNSKTSTGTTPTPTGTGATGGSGGAAGVTASFLATGGAVLLGVVGGGLLVF